MNDEHHVPTRARVAATMKWWGYQGVPDGMIRQIIRDLNEDTTPVPTGLLRRIADG
jgi:hypothetical protein